MVAIRPRDVPGTSAVACSDSQEADAVTMDKIVSLCRGAASCSRRRRSTAASARRSTTATTACSRRTTSAALALGDGAGARRHRRARLVDHPPPAGLGGVRPRRGIHRPARRLQVQAALPGRSPRGRAVRPRPSKHPGETPDCDLTEARQFNLMFETRVGAVEEAGSRSTSAPRPRRGSSSTSRTSPRSRGGSRRSASRRSASRSATRSRRATSSSARSSSSRWRWSSSCRRPRPSSGTATGSTRAALASPLRHPARATSASAQHDAEELLALLERHERHRVPLPDRLVGARGRREPRRLRPHRAHRVLGDEARVGRAGRRALHAARDRAGARRQPLLLAFLVDAYDEEIVAERERTVLRLHPLLAPVKAAILPLIGKNEEMVAQGAGAVRGAAQEALRRVRRRRRDRAALPPPGRDRHAVRVHDRRGDARGRHDHGPRPRLAGSGADPDRAARSALLDRLTQPWSTPKTD